MKTRAFTAFFCLLALSLLMMGLLSGCRNGGNASVGRSEPVFDRVMQSGIIRCGYVPYPPGCIKDPNTGKLTGTHVEAIEMVATNLGLKVKWTEEVAWGTMIEGLKSGRYDMIASPVWPNSARAKDAWFTQPLFYSGIGIFVRQSDTRFANNLESINSPNVRISTSDGDMSESLAKTEFSRAKRVSLPQLSDNSQFFLDLVGNRSDVVFVEPYFADLYAKNNPNKIKNIAADKPIRIFGNCWMIPKGEAQFQQMLNTALTELIYAGEIDKLLAKYAPSNHSFYRSAYPYRSVQ